MLLAAEGHYHRSCYRSYTREEKTASHVTNKQDENEAKYEAALNHSYKELFLFIRGELFVKPRVIAMADVSSRWVASMNSLGIVQVKDSTKKHRSTSVDSWKGSLVEPCISFPISKGNFHVVAPNRQQAKIEFAVSNHVFKGLYDELLIHTITTHA